MTHSTWQAVADRTAEKLGLDPVDVKAHIESVAAAIQARMKEPQTVEIDLLGLNYLRLSRNKLQRSAKALAGRMRTEKHNMGLFGGVNDAKLKQSIQTIEKQLVTIGEAQMLVEGACFLDRKAEFTGRKVKRAKIRNGKITPIKHKR